MEKLTVPGSANLNLSVSEAQQRFCVRQIKEKCVTFYFYKSKAKVSLKLLGGGWFICGEVRSLLPKLIYTQFVSWWSSSHKIVEK